MRLFIAGEHEATTICVRDGNKVAGRRERCTYDGDFLFEVIHVLAGLLLGRLLLILVLRGGHAVAVRPSVLKHTGIINEFGHVLDFLNS